MYAQALGKRLRAARKEMGLTQKQLAERLDVTPSYIARIETGRDNPTIGQLAHISEALGVGLDINFQIPRDRPEDYQRAA